jgi:hypothetical protein
VDDDLSKDIVESEALVALVVEEVRVPFLGESD